LILIAVGCLAGGAVVGAAWSVLSPMGDRASAVANRSLPADQALEAASVQSQVSQTAFLDSLGDAPTRGADIGRAQAASHAEDAAWAAYLRLAGRSTLERRLQGQYRAAGEQSRSLGSAVIASNPSDPAYAGTLAAEQAASAQARTVISQIQSRFYESAIVDGTRTVVSDISNGRLVILLAAVAAFLAFLGFGGVMLRRVWRDERITARDERLRSTERRRAELETRLQRALEMEATEEGTYDLIRQAIDTVADGRAVELLVADSSQAHFRQVLSTVDDRFGACRVAGPSECPAASSGQTRIWNDSANLDTCPYLRNHPERVWASCVPVSIAGRTTGVLHAEGRIEVPPNEELPTELELVARKAGDRIGVQRVLARTEAQAQVDPLTGLPNRRTLENRTINLTQNDTEFVVAFMDLDHFKDLNDLHGHETGDRALRLFSRVLRDSIRPRDVPARYGGEEFVVVLPECSIADARDVAERIRTQLAAALSTGTVPKFTVSVGLALAETGEALSEAIDQADAALLKAKQLGRDRVVIAGELLEPMPGGRPRPAAVPPAA
jgi:diguanylate cyclase (GGDEF)-like protein